MNNINNDLISRQQAIKALNAQAEEMSHWSERYQEQRRGVLTAINIITDCPSLQPDIIRCKDCIYQTKSWSGIKYCEAHGDHIGKDYDYCSNARRKENG